MISTARINTTNAKRYLGQFCKHFAHKLPVHLADTNTEGLVTFPPGTCALEADETRLSLTLTTATSEDMARLQDVAARHLVRFAFREDLAMTWQNAA